MANELTGGGVGAELSTDLNVITAEINAYQRVAGEAIFEIGRRLKHVKENDLVHGEFMEWYESIGLTKDFVSKAMRVTDNLGNFETSRNIGLEALYQIATLPPEQREVEHEINGKTKLPEDMTVRELREVKRQLKAEQERVGRLETEKNAEQSERERLEIENEELTGKPPKIEVRTEYVEIDNTPHDYVAVKGRLQDYEDKFGDVRNYDESVTATHVQDMITSTMSLKRGVREFAKRFAYMPKYRDAINRMDDISKREYNEAVKALHEIAESFEYLDENNGRVIIDQ